MKSLYKSFFGNSLLAAVAASIGSFATYSVLDNERAQDFEIVDCISPTEQAAIHSIDTPIENISIEEDEDEQKLSIANIQPKEVEPRESMLPVASEVPPITKDVLDRAVKERLKRNREINNKIKGFVTSNIQDGSVSIASLLENKFYNESFDEEWAYDKEEKISTVLDNAYEQMDGLQALDISCRSKNCQVTFPIIEGNKISEFYSNLRQISGESDIGMNDPLISYFTDKETNRLIFYFSDNGNTHLFQ